MSKNFHRRHDIDWIRVIAIALLLIYHSSISFQPWGSIVQFIQNEESLDSVWIPMSMVTVWRIPILFFISGIGVFYAMKKRNLISLLRERARRILIPFFFGYFVLVPIHFYLFQNYYDIDLTYLPGSGHLWFLANIFIYVLLLSPLFFWLKSNYDNIIIRTTRKLLKNPIGVYVFLLPFIIEVLLVKPKQFTLYLFTKHGFWLGLLAFYFGYLFVEIGDELWKRLAKLKFINLILAFILFIIRWMFYEFRAPVFLISVECILWIFTIFGMGFTYLNFENKTVTYLSRAAYPVYIIHMIFQYSFAYLIFPLEVKPEFKYPILVIMTIGSSVSSYEFVINRNKFIRPFFGLNYKKK